MRILHLLCLPAFALATGPATAAGPPVDRDHPILGSWTFTMDGGACTETYRFRADGTTIVTSGDEVAVSRYEISARPSAKGFYKWTDKIVKDNGGKDCGGNVTAPGTRSTNYLRFDPSGEQMIACKAESPEACFGPLQRVHGMDS